MNDPLPWIILFLPLLSAVVITLFTLNNHRVSAMISIGAVLVSLLLSADLFYNSLAGAPPQDISLVWLQVGSLNIHFGMHFDGMSLLMLLIVTGVGSLIHIYSAGYMKGDISEGRFFAELSLFIFSMLGIVLSDNFFHMFIFWELVGLSSYLLVGFWYEKPSAADAAKKAFLTNRIGDFGFFNGILLVWAVTGTLSFTGVHTQMRNNPEIFDTATTGVGLLIFCGAIGKSAQFPLHVWLPDAMEGPTPVSALIHAATMVAAGVYMLCRVFFIFSPPALVVVAWIGGITALMSALIACQQDDIKRILAYSTLSQLGYMVMAVGLGEPPAAMFHLATHAFFKALLFLGAGSVIHGLSNEQNIWKMGRLREKMPLTYWTFLAATLALCGCPFFSGFYSKDAVLAAAYHGSHTLFALGVLVAFLTTFYMFRLIFVVFLGKAKSHGVDHAHESPAVMTMPLMILCIASIFGAFFGIQNLLAGQFDLPSVPQFAPLEPFQEAPFAALLGVVAFAIGLKRTRCRQRCRR
jgi:NADH-quinone oxidoreductase subunit L